MHVVKAMWAGMLWLHAYSFMITTINTVKYWMLCFNGPLHIYTIVVFLDSYITIVDICNDTDWNLLLYLMN